MWVINLDLRRFSAEGLPVWKCLDVSCLMVKCSLALLICYKLTSDSHIDQHFNAAKYFQNSGLLNLVFETFESKKPLQNADGKKL